MTRYKKHEPPPRPKRGPGRPPLDPNGETVEFSLRIVERHFVELRRIIASGHGPTIADAIRWLIDESAKG